jgi:hypothetical protein
MPQSVGNRSVLDQSIVSIWAEKRTQNGITRNRVGLPLIAKEDPGNTLLTAEPSLKIGTPSIVNPYAIVSYPNKFGEGYNAIIDDPNSPTKFSSSRASGQVLSWNNSVSNLEPTVFNLVNTPPDGSSSWSDSKTPYRYTDFLYCKYYGKIPNNHLITLRRYPAPTFDNLAIPLTIEERNNPSGKEQNGFKPIAQAVTWLGEETENKMSEILGFEVLMNWKLYESQVETVPGNEQDAEDGPDIFNGAAKFLSILTGNVGNPFDQKNSQYDPYSNGPYSHRVYGPVNVIAKTYKRDRGLDFKQSFSLNFHYSLKSIGNINPKAAMLDIMANMMQLTYNNAAFWGGANRYFAQKPIYPFIGGKEGMNAWYRGDPVGFSKAVGAQMGSAIKEISKFFTDMLADPINELKKLAVGGSKLATNYFSKGRAPDIVAMKALLTGEPVGEWHMVVGNPYSPIMKVGNLICTSAKFQFNDTLGADNFPTELKVTVTLEHGRPRDKGDIESMFNDGEGRIYFAAKGMGDVFKSSAQENSKNDNSFGGELSKRMQILAANRGASQVSPLGSNSPTSSKDNAMPYSSGIGAENEFDKVVKNLSQPFLQDGHALAVKMGLMSAGPRELKQPTKTQAAQKGKQ